MNILLLCIGKLKEEYSRLACADYAGRIRRMAKLEIAEIPEAPESKGARGLVAEGELLLARLRAEDRVIALCVEGNAMDSPGFAQLLAGQPGRRLVLIVGGSNGLSEAVKRRADVRLSFSKMTLPHQLMRVVLLEQVYRGLKIGAGQQYHK